MKSQHDKVYFPSKLLYYHIDNVELQHKVVDYVCVEDLALDFTIPGYDIELRVSCCTNKMFVLADCHAQKPGGRDMQVTSRNVREYVQEVLDAIIGKGAHLQAKAFRDGFSKVFLITDLQAFSADELVILFGNADEDWSTESE